MQRPPKDGGLERGRLLFPHKVAVLDERDREAVEGTHGEAARLAMSIVARMAAISGAPHFIDISSAQIARFQQP